jgi:hypothetical protein
LAEAGILRTSDEPAIVAVNRFWSSDAFDREFAA